MKTTAMHRIAYGVQSTIQEYTPATDTTGGWDSIIKFQAEAPVVRMRLHFHQKSSFYECSGFTASVAPTEISAYDTLAHAYTAQYLGANNNVVASGSNPYGFTQFTFNGALSSGVLQASNQPIAPDATGYSDIADTVSTDWLGVTSVPCVDQVTETTFYILRIAFPKVIGQNWNGVYSMDGYQQLYEGLFTPYAMEGSMPYGIAHEGALYKQYNNGKVPIGSVARLLIGAHGNQIWDNNVSNYADDGQAVINPASMPSTFITDAIPYFTIELDYGIRTISVWHPGDSITEGYWWPYMATCQMSTPQKPWNSLNMGGSTTRTSSYLAILYNYLQKFTAPDVVVLQSISINNYSPIDTFNQANAEMEAARLSGVVNDLVRMGIKVILWTCYNWGVETPGTPITYINNAVRGLCAAGLATLMEINNDPDFNRSVYDPVANPSGMIASDNTHPSNPTGIIYFTDKLLTAYKALGF